VLQRGEVVTQVHGRVHFLAVVPIGPALREVGEDLGVARLDEGALPERPRLGAGGELALRVLRFLAQVTVEVRKAAVN